MLHISLRTSIGVLRVTTDWPTLIYFLRARMHPWPPWEERDIAVEVRLGSLDEAGDLWLTGDSGPGARPRTIRVADSVFEIDRDSIRGIVPRESVHKGVVLEWLWYALPICCAPDGWEALHAAAVERGGRAVLFGGGSDARKTTRALRGMQAGDARFLADDIVLLNRSGLVRGWDTTLHIHPGRAGMVGTEGSTFDSAGKTRVSAANLAERQELHIAEILGEMEPHAGEGFDSTWIPKRNGLRGLRVAVQNRMEGLGPLSFFGGDIVHARGYAAGLRHHGMEATLRGLDWADYHDCDIVHLMHVQYDWAQEAGLRAASAGVPLVVSAITHGSPPKGILEPLVTAAAKVLCYSESERAFYLRGFPEQPTEKFVVVPMGVPADLYALHGVTSTPSVFVAGTYSVEKNRLNVLRACIKLNVPITFAGPMDRETSQEYVWQLREEAGNWKGARFFGLLHGSALWDQYRRAHVHVDAAYIEPFGLGTLEALAAGCNIVHTKHSWAAEDFAQYGSLCEPSDVDSIVAAIKHELSRPRGWHGCRPLTWSEAARVLIPIYTEVCGAALPA